MNTSTPHATIWHNPSCSTSRNTLALLREAGIEPRIVDYRTTPPTHEELRSLLARAGIPVRDAIRTKEPAYAAHHLDDPTLDDDTLLAAILRDPILLQRPLVETDLGVRLCRPADTVREILPR